MAKNSKALTAASMIVAGFSLTAQAAPAPSPIIGGVVVVGGDDCGIWVASRTARTSVALEALTQGFLNGLALGSGVEFWQATDSTISREAVYLWMDNYCRQHPLEQLTKAWVALFTERTGQPLAR
jgi:hypothetical protein